MPTTAQMIDALLEMRRQQGDISEEHFWHLVERFRADLVHQASLILHSQEDAEDVAQNSLCEAFEGLRNLRDPHKLGAWMRQINRRNALDHARRRNSAREQRLNTGELDVVRPAAGSAIDIRKGPAQNDANSGLENEEILQAVESLPAVFREVVILRYMEGLLCDEIALRIGVPGGTVRSRLCRADAMLVRKLGVLEPTPESQPEECAR